MKKLLQKELRLLTESEVNSVEYTHYICNGIIFEDLIKSGFSKTKALRFLNELEELAISKNYGIAKQYNDYIFTKEVREILSNKFNIFTLTIRENTWEEEEVEEIEKELEGKELTEFLEFKKDMNNAIIEKLAELKYGVTK